MQSTVSIQIQPSDGSFQINRILIDFSKYIELKLYQEGFRVYISNEDKDVGS